MPQDPVTTVQVAAGRRYAIRLRATPAPTARARTWVGRRRHSLGEAALAGSLLVFAADWATGDVPAGALFPGVLGGLYVVGAVGHWQAGR